MESGILILNKPEGMTSREVDNRIGRLFQTKKVGHLGTLDPFATGILIVAVNKGTKFLPFLEDGEKTYEATLILGKKTSTGDKTGEAILEKPVPELSGDIIRSAMDSFLGEGTQIPPMTSAKKVDGVPLYKKAHKGIEVERQPISIFIKSLNLISFDNENDTLVFSATVSKGTYIRVLGEDLAEKLGTLGYLASLERTKVGEVDLAQSIDLDAVGPDSFIAPETLLTNFPNIRVKKEDEKAIMDGRPFAYSGAEPRLLLLGENGPLAVYKRDENSKYICERGLF